MLCRPTLPHVTVNARRPFDRHEDADGEGFRAANILAADARCLAAGLGDLQQTNRRIDWGSAESQDGKTGDGRSEGEWDGLAVPLLYTTASSRAIHAAEKSHAIF